MKKHLSLRLSHLKAVALTFVSPGFRLKAQRAISLDRLKTIDPTYLLLGAILFLIAMHAMGASSDTTFDVAVTKVNEWIGGSLGKLCALGSLAIGLIVAIVKQSLMSVAVGVGIGLCGSVGPGILMALFSATI